MVIACFFDTCDEQDPPGVIEGSFRIESCNGQLGRRYLALHLLSSCYKAVLHHLLREQGFQREWCGSQQKKGWKTITNEKVTLEELAS